MSPEQRAGHPQPTVGSQAVEKFGTVCVIRVRAVSDSFKKLKKKNWEGKVRGYSSPLRPRRRRGVCKVCGKNIGVHSANMFVHRAASCTALES